MIINLHKEAGPRALVRWAKASGRYVRIDRLGPRGNPYRIPEDGDRQTVIRRYAEEHLPAHPDLLARREAGERRGGNVLGCWCAPPEGLTAGHRRLAAGNLPRAGPAGRRAAGDPGGGANAMSRLYDRLLASPRVEERFKAMLRTATVVVGDPVSDYYFQGTEQEHWSLPEDFPTVAPPLQTAFYDFRAPPGRFTRCNGRAVPWGGAARAWGALVVAQDIAPGEVAEVGDFRWPGLRWLLYLFVVLEYEKGHAAGPLLLHTIGVRPDGSAAVGPEYPNGIAAAATLPVEEGEWRGRGERDPAVLNEEVGSRAAECYTFLNTVLLTTCFMHCKNVAVRDAPAPPERLARAYQRRYGRPLVSYKVLDIRPLREVLRTEGQAEHGGLKRAVHLCRGHFAHYTEERPLFGKIAGTVWRPMHVRGDRRAGLALKDYAVHPDTP